MCSKISVVNKKEIFCAIEIKDRIEKYDFIKNIDYFKVIPHKELKQTKNFDFTILRNQKSKRGGDVRTIEYILTIDMAKEVAMLKKFNNRKNISKGEIY